jgi:hypothetical protein
MHRQPTGVPHLATRQREDGAANRRSTSERRGSGSIAPLLRPPLGGLGGFLGGCALEAVPRGFDLGFRGSMTPRPCLGDGCREFSDVEPYDGAGSAMNEAGALSGVRLRCYPQTKQRYARPPCPHVRPPSCLALQSSTHGT